MQVSVVSMNMNDEVQKRREAISALADGQLRGDEFARTVQAVALDADAQATWDAYHLVGDVLRNGALGAHVRDQAFVARLNARLSRETEVLRPSLPVATPVEVASRPAQDIAVAVDRPHAEAANAPSFRWKMVAGFASLAAVAAIGWNVLGGWGSGSGHPQLALVPVPQRTAPAVEQAAATAPGNEQVVMIRDPRLDELLAAHKQFGGTSALQMPAGFLRNATFEGGGR
jgi:sigma-E factor negative regulatory protein RseA